MSAPDELIVAITTRLFQDLGDPQTINNADDDAWCDPLWQSLEAMGLTRARVPEALGGAGASAHAIQIAGALQALLDRDNLTEAIGGLGARLFRALCGE